MVSETDIIVLALPLSKIDTIPKLNKNDQIVKDTINYWVEIDGLKRIPSNPNITSSELVTQTIQTNRVVKAFDHMEYHDLEFESHAKNPKVIAYASDDEGAKEFVQKFIIVLGLVSFDLGRLKEGKILEPGSSFIGANLTHEQFQDLLYKNTETI